MSTVDRLEILREKLTEEKNAYNRMYNMYVEKEEEIERLHSIIKEVREYMEKQLKLLPHYMYEAEMYKILEILEKENKE